MSLFGASFCTRGHLSLYRHGKEADNKNDVMTMELSKICITKCTCNFPPFPYQNFRNIFYIILDVNDDND